jgi:hypothetical protein
MNLILEQVAVRGNRHGEDAERSEEDEAIQGTKRGAR